MSDFTAVRAVSQTLKELLEREITNSDNTEVFGVPIFLNSPRFLREEKNTSGISLWLYMMRREPDTLNRPQERPASSQIKRRPLPLTLHYLICALHKEPLDEQKLLGKVAQVFHDHAIIEPGDLRETLAGEDLQLRLVLDAPTLEELSRVWDALNEPYQLSLAYTVQVVSIDSDRDAAVRPPVLVSTQQPSQIAGGGAA
ncbi:MAG: hypothetical protein QOC81_1061 [Thermoanaerobaculia bacterium]|nr:hypothetical protein [Thermoanaerobaculia bacterium]